MMTSVSKGGNFQERKVKQAKFQYRKQNRVPLILSLWSVTVNRSLQIQLP
jgi:hypothetical protein